jgi:hypothetical protein
LGNLYKLGDIYFTSVADESYDYSNSITENSVEDGSIVSDHIKNNLTKLSINGVLRGITAFPQEEYNTLLNYLKNGEILNYVGVQSFSQCAIESLSPSFTKDIANGFAFSMSLKEIRVANKVIVNINTDVLNIPNIEQLKTELEAQRSIDKNAITARVKEVNGVGRQGKTVKNTESVLDAIKATIAPGGI